ncbi:MAG: type I glyceraldehyde-3-phosphate dehydrogenase [Chloroflexi bacterium]|nr:type I glyceraldehyde-3-phosphate dehydrogenase [Chloroflexota bacterium]
MPTRIGINGFGRIGRQVTRSIMERHKDELEVVAVNDLTDCQTNAHLFKYDTNYGRYPGTVEVADDHIIVDGHPIRVLAERDPAKLPWGDLGVDLVVESTGLFTSADRAAAHLEGGAKKVVISAPAKGEVLMVVMGVNEDKYDPSLHDVVSNASCTTNCVAPLVKVLHQHFGISNALMSTVHAYTSDQRILDTFHTDLRRARTAAANIIPTTTGAAKAVGVVLPELQGKIHGIALRVPVPTVSLVDLVANVERPVTREEINQVFKEESQEALKGILEYCEEELVSSDFKGNPASSIFDASCTMVMGDTMVKVLSWYDNEWGYSCRVGDLAAYMVARGL